MTTSVYVQLPLFAAGKVCRACGMEKPPRDFYRDRSTPDGLKRICKPCAARQASAYNKAHRTQRYAYTRQWVAQNHEEFMEWRRQYRHEHAEQIKLSRERHYAANRERVLAQNRRWQQAHPDHVRRLGRVRQRRRLAREKRAAGHHTWADVEAIYGEQCDLCYYCAEPLHGRFEVDHKQPLSRGGSQWPANLACVCACCNRSKSARTEAEFKALLAGRAVSLPARPR